LCQLVRKSEVALAFAHTGRDTHTKYLSLPQALEGPAHHRHVLDYIATWNHTAYLGIPPTHHVRGLERFIQCRRHIAVAPRRRVPTLSTVVGGYPVLAPHRNFDFVAQQRTLASEGQAGEQRGVHQMTVTDLEPS
jgi:hypothetical protein